MRQLRIGIFGVAIGLAACSAPVVSETGIGNTNPSTQRGEPRASLNPNTTLASETTAHVSSGPLMVQLRSDLDGEWRLVEATFGMPANPWIGLRIRGPRTPGTTDFVRYGVSGNVLNTEVPQFGGIRGWAGSDGCNGFQYHYEHDELTAFQTMMLCPDIDDFVVQFRRVLETATFAQVINDRLIVTSPTGDLTFEHTT